MHKKESSLIKLAPSLHHHSSPLNHYIPVSLLSPSPPHHHHHQVTSFSVPTSHQSSPSLPTYHHSNNFITTSSPSQPQVITIIITASSTISTRLEPHYHYPPVVTSIFISPLTAPLHHRPFIIPSPPFSSIISLISASSISPVSLLFHIHHRLCIWDSVVQR